MRSRWIAGACAFGLAVGCTHTVETRVADDAEIARLESELLDRVVQLTDRIDAAQATLDALSARADALRIEVARGQEALAARLAEVERRAADVAAPAEAAAPAVPERAWAEVHRDQEVRAVAKVPYLVNPRSQMAEVMVWADAERTARRAQHKVPKGTRIEKILATKELARIRGGTMYKIRCVTGEEGWVPHFCIEYRRK